LAGVGRWKITQEKNQCPNTQWKCNTFSRWAYVIVAAEDADKAEEAVIFDESGRTWDNAAEDYDSALHTTIGAARSLTRR